QCGCSCQWKVAPKPPPTTAIRSLTSFLRGCGAACDASRRGVRPAKVVPAPINVAPAEPRKVRRDARPEFQVAMADLSTSKLAISCTWLPRKATWLASEAAKQPVCPSRAGHEMAYKPFYLEMVGKASLTVVPC